MGRFFRTLLINMLIGSVLLWCVGLYIFTISLPEATDTNARQAADAIVVLTGGVDRLEEGFRLLKEGRAKAMLISGVGKGAQLHELPGATLIENDPQLASRVSLGYMADSTRTNALEARDWMLDHGYRSMLLVTASYHIPRSLLDFSLLMPGYTILPHPVEPSDFSRKVWWKDSRSLRLLASEFNKYLVTRFKTQNAAFEDAGEPA